MDRIIGSLLKHFKILNGYDALDTASVFERFVSHCCVSQRYQETFSIEDLATGGQADLGIDSIAIIVNGAIVTSPEEIDDLRELNNSLAVDFLFCQAKSGKKFQGAMIADFIAGVAEFFSETPRSPRNDQSQSGLLPVLRSNR